MKKIKAILVDDEDSALKGLMNKVEKLFPAIDILSIYQKPEDAIVAINNLEPDLVFLDIEMPRMNGFELLSELKHINFQVIFVTAYSEYALEALKQSAIDYLLKPVDDIDLKRAVNKALQIINEKKQNESNSNLVSLLSKSKSESCMAAPYSPAKRSSSVSDHRLIGCHPNRVCVAPRVLPPRPQLAHHL